MPENQSSAPPNRALVALVVTLFFIWGFATVLVDTLVPKLKASFSLSYAEVMLTQFSFFLAYLVVSLPAGALIARIGYIHGAIVGLVLMAAGCCALRAGGLAWASSAAFCSRSSSWRRVSRSCRSRPIR